MDPGWIMLIIAASKNASVRYGWELAVWATAILVGLLVAVAAWSVARRNRRVQQLEEETRRRRTDPWAEAGERMATPTAAELEEMMGSKPGRGEAGGEG